MEEAGSLSVAEDTAEARSIGGEIAGEICIGDAIMYGDGLEDTEAEEGAERASVVVLEGGRGQFAKIGDLKGKRLGSMNVLRLRSSAYILGAR